MESFFIKIALATILFSVSLAEEGPGYYWKDYNGVVPDDAVPGGHDVNNRTTYIGQGFLKDYGNLPGTIYPGEKDMKVTVNGVKQADTDIKILCSYRWALLRWVQSTADDFKRSMNNRYPVLGGVEHTYGETYRLNIGRITYQGAVVVGKIVPIRRPRKFLMYHVSNGRELSSDSYEVLVAEPVQPKVANTLEKE